MPFNVDTVWSSGGVTKLSTARTAPSAFMPRPCWNYFLRIGVSSQQQQLLSSHICEPIFTMSHNRNPSEPSSDQQQVLTDNPEEYLPNFQWMRENVGEVLVQGIAETLLLRPNDPIEYLGQWLAQHAKNVQLEKKLQEEKAQLQAELEERRQVVEEKQRKAQEKLAKEQAKRDATLKAQAYAKEKEEAEQRARELEQMRAERTENRPPPAFGIPETIVEVPSVASVTGGSATNV